MIALGLLSASVVQPPLVSAWVVGYNPTSLVRFREQAKNLDLVFVEYYTLNADGKPIRRTQYDSFFAEARTVARRNKVSFYAMLNNYSTDPGMAEGFEPNRVTKAIQTPIARARFANQISQMLARDGADGIDLDLESLNATDRQNYVEFAKVLAAELARSGKKLSVTVHPKQEDQGGWSGAIAHDYAGLGMATNIFNVMTYDYSWSTSPAGPIAPTTWVKNVMNYAKSRVPARKLGMGIACYGYDWSVNPARSMTWDETPPSLISIDPLSGERFTATMRYSGATAFQQKFEAAKELGINSVAFWYVGSEEPSVWTYIRSQKKSGL